MNFIKLKNFGKLLGLLVCVTANAQTKEVAPIYSGTLNDLMALTPEASRAEIEQRLLNNASLSLAQFKEIHIKIDAQNKKGSVSVDEDTNITPKQLILIGGEIALALPVALPLTFSEIYQYRFENKDWYKRVYLDGSLQQQISFNSQYLNVGLDVHPFGLPLFVGAKYGVYYFNPPWSAKYDSYWDRVGAYSVGIGTRGSLSKKKPVLKNLVGSVELGMMDNTSDLYASTKNIYLHLGLYYKVWKR